MFRWGIFVLELRCVLIKVNIEPRTKRTGGSTTKADQHRIRNSTPHPGASTAQLTQLQDGQAIHISGTICKLTPLVTKQGRSMAVLTLQDHDGEVEVLVFPETYAQCKQALQAGAQITVTGAVNLREDKPKIYANQIVQNGG